MSQTFKFQNGNAHHIQKAYQKKSASAEGDVYGYEPTYFIYSHQRKFDIKFIHVGDDL